MRERWRDGVRWEQLPSHVLGVTYAELLTTA